jgi:peptidoglycan/xylan/chitin deacetylase (PgdA/CDA1 family)
LTLEETPQLVLITFEDSVNDVHNKVFEMLFNASKRTNPNGCDIRATFFVSHEWTDYALVQNLYADGHEIASHTIS